MEITSFALGMLTMIAVMVIIAVVVGLVGVYRLSGQLRSTINELQSSSENAHRRIDDEVNKIERHISENMMVCDQQFKHFEDYVRGISKDKDDQISNLTSYVDSRIDKLMNSLNK
jgi:hypothetical protein